MSVLGLGYVGIEAQDAAAWAPFATGFAGMQRLEAGGGAAAYGVDDAGRRLVVMPAGRDGGAFYGWEVADADALDAMAARIEDRGVAVVRSTAAERALRGVDDMVHCADPAGHRVELFHGLEPAGGPFAPGREMAGFRTGGLGLGHVLVHAPDADGCAPRSTARRSASGSATGRRRRSRRRSCTAIRGTTRSPSSAAARRACTT